VPKSGTVPGTSKFDRKEYIGANDRRETMRKFLFVLASTGSLTTMNAAIAQNPVTGFYATGYYGPGYIAPGYYGPGYIAPRYVDPGYYAPGYIAPGYTTPGSIAPRYVAPGYTVARPQREEYVGECAIGMSEETCRRRGQKYNPPRQN
jgi:hypothetical protein